MKKIFTSMILLMAISNAFSQDDAALSAPLGTIISPVTGCALTNAEIVTVRIFNAGPGAINAPFDVSYNITGPIASSATETVLVGTIPVNSTFTYSFTTTADLSTAGVYNLDATVTVAGDPNPTNNTYTGWAINNNAASNGGTATGGMAVCNNNNSGNVTLVGNVGNVLNWEYSTDNGITWFNISNTTTSQSYDDLTTETWYRANVQNASCAIATSTIAIMTIDATSVGGSTGAALNVCSGSNSGTINLTGKVGNVLQWEFSTDGGITWTPIANTTTSQSYLNLTTSTRYRVLVQNGSCPAVYSSQKIITVSPNTVPGSVTADATECAGANSGTLNLVGSTGNVTLWQFSTDGGGIWNNIANTTTSESYLNLTTTTMYRAAVKSGVCPQLVSTPATITVIANSDGGTINSNMTVCDAVNDDTLVLNGFNGTILDWEFSTDGGLSFASAGTNNDSLFFSGLTTETIYRAVVQAGTCLPANSATATISIDSPSQGGNLSSDATVCASGNSGTINLAGQNGMPIQWESSTDGGITWSIIGNTSLNENYLNLIDTTLYRSLVQNGQCLAEYSDTVTITVDPISAGGTVNSSATVCEGNNSGTLILVGETGTVQNWETSTDGGFTWVSIANTTTSQNYLNIMTNTLYRANVQSGVCPSTLSGIATMSVDQVANAGNILGGTTVCEGSNSGSMTLVGTTGTILDWETSTDGGLTWNPVGNSTSIENYTNLVSTTDYRAIAVSGVCPNDTSLVSTVIVDALTVGGTVSMDATVCELANSGTLNLTGETGNVLNWEMSTDGGNTWLTLANSSTSQNYLDLNTTTLFRANVKNGVCSNQGSAPATITVSPASDGGAVSSSETVCQGLNAGILTLTGFEGVILDWETSTDFGATWTSLGNTSTTQNYTNLNDTTWFHAIVQNGICPQDTSAEAFINLYPSPQADFFAFGANVDACSQENITFLNQSTTNGGFITFHSWDFQDGTTSTLVSPLHSYSVAATYQVTLFVMNNFGCSDTIMKPLIIHQTPVADIVALGPTSICEGDTVTLGSLLDPNYNYIWSSGETSNSIFATSNGFYVLEVSDIINGCVGVDSMEVVVYPTPIANAGLDTTVDLGYTVMLSASGGTNYLWTPSYNLSDASSPNPICTPDSSRIYYLTVTDINGCTDTDTVVVTLSGNSILTFYNIITPNGDGFNDAWVIGNLENFPNNSVSIFNRYGQLVYEATNYTNDWDGTRNGDLLPDGSYYYVLEMTDSGEIFKGSINIVSSTK